MLTHQRVLLMEKCKEKVKEDGSVFAHGMSRGGIAPSSGVYEVTKARKERTEECSDAVKNTLGEVNAQVVKFRASGDDDRMKKAKVSLLLFALGKHVRSFSIYFLFSCSKMTS